MKNKEVRRNKQKTEFFCTTFMKWGTCFYPYMSRGMQKWYRKPPPWLLRVHGEHWQGNIHASHQVGVGVCWLSNVPH